MKVVLCFCWAFAGLVSKSNLFLHNSTITTVHRRPTLARLDQAEPGYRVSSRAAAGLLSPWGPSLKFRHKTTTTTIKTRACMHLYFALKTASQLLPGRLGKQCQQGRRGHASQHRVPPVAKLLAGSFEINFLILVLYTELGSESQVKVKIISPFTYATEFCRYPIPACLPIHLASCLTE
jgi:hypothetical protein